MSKQHPKCPFENALAAGCNEGELYRLAVIIKGAHSVTDIWAGVRVERALRGYQDDGLGGYLNGKHFASFVEDDGEIPDWQLLQDYAHDFESVHLTTANGILWTHATSGR